ncbi:MAG: hypothetical protein QM535_08390 [Limnohabitans sp.]|nr:hypothetical protein [Limnohabitans sp.]
MTRKKYVGQTDGTINSQPYESETIMEMFENGNLEGDIIVRKLPSGFNLAILSLSNSSQKIAALSRSDDGNPNIYEYLDGNGTIISSRIYTYPDYPDASISQIGKAILSKEGIEYKNTINGFTGSLPTDIIEIKPYFQEVTKRKEGGLQLRASTIIVSESLGEIKTEIIGTYTFEGENEFPYQYYIEHSPTFSIEGENHFRSNNFFEGEMIIKMKQSVISKKR